jgi:Cu2+-exporting ATPase
MEEEFRRKFWVSLVLTIPVLALSPEFFGLFGVAPVLAFPGDRYVRFLFASAIYFYGGVPFLRGMYDEWRNRLPGMMTLIGVAITVAYVYSTAVVFGLPGMGFYWELATLIDIMLLGHWLEMRSVRSASSALEELAKLLPKEAHRLRSDGGTEETPIAELDKGDRVLVKPGEKIPVDGKVVEGETTVNESMITGETKPVPRQAGDEVVAGSVNGEGSVTVTVEKTGEDSFLAQVAKLVKQAQESKSRSQDLANRAAVVLTVVALAGGAITLIAWLGFLGRDIAFSIERAVTVMVIACPHALGLAIPLVVAVSAGIAARNGFIIRERMAFERARNIGAVIFDKTGTLTLGKFGVSDVVPLEKEWDAEKILRFAASVESRSEHPIARGIVAAVPEYPPAEEFNAIPGKGARARVEGRTVMVVSPGYLEANAIAVPREKVNALAAQGKTVVLLLVENTPVGAVALDDIIRPESKDAVAQLKAMGITPIMLTGDNRFTAGRVAREVGIEHYFAEVLPGHKADKVKEVQQRGIVTAMVGDGVNDAPALAQADVGIAIGAGTDVAMETAGVVLVRDNPRDVATIIELSRATWRKMLQNLGWATGYNVIALPLAAGVLAGAGILLTPATGAILMSVSTIIVAINARLLHLG